MTQPQIDAPTATGNQPQDNPQLAQEKERAWSLLNAGDQQAAQALIKEALKRNPGDKDLQAMAVLGERHQIVMDNGALARKIAALGVGRRAQVLAAERRPRALEAAMPGSELAGTALRYLAGQAKQPPARGALSQAAFEKMRLGDYSGAEKELDEAIRLEAGDWLAYRLRAFSRYYQKKNLESESDADIALQLKPDDGPSHRVKAFLRLDAHDPQGAVEQATRALDADPRDVEALLTRARALEALGRPVEAAADRELAKKLDPRFGPRSLAAQDTADPRLSRTHAIYAGALGLAVLLFGVTLLSRRGPETRASAAEVAAMRAEDRTPVGGVPGFRILRRLGQGGMGVVYEAYDDSLQRKVAIKRMREEIAGDPRERKRFIREARLVAGLRHPGIVEIFSLVEQDSALYLVFEYLPGETLDGLLERRGGRLKAPEALRVLREVAEALDYAHAQGVVHQDLKPSNILVSATGAKVMDFGIARRVQDTLSTMSRAEAVGTPAYMAPEQELGVITPKADLFALGVCAYELLAGRAPFGRGGGLSKVDGQFEPLSRAAGAPRAADAAIAAALSAEPDKRPATAGAFVASLEAAFAADKTPA